MKYFIHSILFSLFFVSATAQQVPFVYEQLQAEMKISMLCLSNDSLQGRLVGSPGEKIAYTYISQKFQQYNVQPKGEQKYLQPFTLKRFSVYTEGTFFDLKKGGRKLTFIGSYPKLFPASVSGPGKAKAKTVFMGYGIISGDGSMDDYAGKTVKGKIVVFQSGYPSSTFSIHSAVAAASSLEAKVDTAIARGAIGVLVLHVDTSAAVPRYKKYVQKNQSRNIPVMHFITQSETDLFDRAELLLDVRANEVEIVGHNVVGYIDNKAQKTVVIGAHYDHLGYDEFGNSTWRPDANEAQQIHNGADDNASGTTALITLAGTLSKYGSKNLNYCFIAFSGEEEGLLGSNYFVKHPTIDMKHVLAMINMDMVGRLDEQKYTLGINGTGTSKEWNSLLGTITIDSLKYKYTESGTGASDHTSFYNDSIPVLHYFTGTHYDYHKPSDDEEKINYDGMFKVVKHIYLLTEKLSATPQLNFVRTKEDTSARISFKVTLGIMPDYMYEGKGVKIDGVTPDKPAAIAGIQKGDCILKLGNISIDTMQDYMKALAAFKKGDRTTVEINRAGNILIKEVIF